MTKAKTSRKTSKNKSETLAFQAESKRLLKLVINSMYSNQEIFLRELLSNASDAADRLRFEALTNQKITANADELKAVVTFDAKAGSITISDNGIGMSRQEVIDNLGTIAKSGTEQFLSSLTGDQKKDTQLIGQFGIGFYSAFIVADEVHVKTRKAGLESSDGVSWISRAEDSYILENTECPENGTEIVLHLKDKYKDLADGYRLRHIINKYMDHLAIPVYMPKEQSGNIDTAQEDADESAKTSTLEVVNSNKALWTLAAKDISDDDYNGFYKHIAHDYQDPLAWSHKRVEGSLEYTNLLYIPKQAQFDLYNRDTPKGLKLFVQRVFIMDDAIQMLPLYLRFVRGIVDCNDLPLNVSREILQNDKRVAKLKKMLTKQVLNLLTTLAKDKPKDYELFWVQFGPVFKEGLVEENASNEQLLDLLRFASTNDDPVASASDDDAASASKSEQGVSLADYVKRMPKDQEKIYYLVGDNLVAVRQNSSLEVLQNRGWEALLCYDRIDPWVISRLENYKDIKFADLSKADLKVEGLDAKVKGEESAAVIKKITDAIGDSVKEVRVSNRLTNSPSCLTLSEHDMNPQLRQMFEASGKKMPESKPILEINMTHPLVKQLVKLDGDKFKDLSHVLLAQAYFGQNTLPKDPGVYTNRLNKMLVDLMSAQN